MHKRLLTLALILGGLFSAYAFLGSVSAQTTQDPFETPACPQIAWSCAEVTDLDAGKNSIPHRQQLKQSGMPTEDQSGNPQQFIIACGMNTDKGFLATTGNKALDTEYCLSSGEFDTLDYLKKQYGYSLRLVDFSNPFTSTGGNIDKTVVPSNIGEARTHMCMIGWKLPVETTGGTDSDPSKSDASNDGSGLEYTSFTFPRGAAQCTAVYADPYGRTYNEDLKPVPGADVSIYDYDSETLLNIFGLVNPVRTDIDGIFNFNIQPGRSYLQTNLTNVTQVHPNFNLAYTTPYTYGDLIVETLGNAEQRDIAVSGGGTPVLKLTGYSHVKTGDEILIQGSASWPLTMVDLMQGSTSLMQQQSTKFGNFEFRVDPSTIDPSQQLTVKLTEVDLTTNPHVPASNPATDSVVLDPIPSYLEGYAYDLAGNKIPFATIRIRLQLTDAIYYETRADKDAFYSVQPRNLPIMPYYIEIAGANTVPGTTAGSTGNTGGGSTGTTGSTGTDTSAGGATGADTSGTETGTGTRAAASFPITIPQYARQNKEYHAVNSVNIMAGTKNGIKVDPRAVADSSSAVFGNQGPASNKMEQTSPADELAQTATKQPYLKALIYVVILIFMGTIAVLFIKKRAQHPDSLNQQTYTRDKSPEPVDNSFEE